MGVNKGRPGTTHCGRWTSNVPADIQTTRLVCTEPAGHNGRHRSNWSGYEWAEGLRPRRRSGKPKAGA